MTINLTVNRDTNTYLVEARHGLIPTCIVCKKFEPVLLRGEDYWKYYQQGAPLDVAFPYLSLSEREIFITGIHPKCWDEMFSREEDDDED